VDDHDESGAVWGQRDLSWFCVRSIITGCVGKCLRALPRASYRSSDDGKTQFLHAVSKGHFGPTTQRQIHHLTRRPSMNKDTIEGNWKQLKGKVKEQWGKLTDDDFDVIAGKRDQLLGRIQERHGISRDEAEKQVADWETRDGRTPAALWMEKY
jgi:uncharacterized protein YjbJ (UPF0337 family)